VELEDRITIATPEGVELSLTLAGVGSRFVSAFVDFTIQILLILALYLVFVLSDLGGYGAAVYAIFSFVVVFGYDVFFEVLASGRTLGKRWNGLRVVRTDGRPITLLPSLTRNLLRLVDFLPFGYLVGIVAVLATRRNQRLGDLAAATLVIRERRTRAAEQSPPASAPDALRPEVATLDTSAVTAEELAAITRFFARRREIDNDARRELAHTMAERLRPKVGGAPDEVHGEQFLELIVSAKAARGEKLR
jgi:uncharacterized RDD family membrane protein YckC